MTEEMDIKVENKLVIEKRVLSIYSHSTNSAHLISHENSFTLPLGSVETGDYLDISIVSGPGPLKKDCWVDLPLWVDFEFSLEGKVTITHPGDFQRILLKISPGPTTWQLRVTRSDDFQSLPSSDHVTIGDAAPKVLG